MAILGTIDPTQDIILLGPVQVTGFADDDHVTIVRDDNISTRRTGNNGDTTIIINPDKTGTMTLRLMETSPTNQILWTYLTALNTAATEGIFTVQALRNESSILPVTRGWLEQQPEVSYGKEVNIYEWNITLENATMGAAAGLGNVVGLVG